MRNYYKNKNRGQAMLIAVLFFLIISSTVVMGIILPIIKQTQISGDLIKSKESYYLAEGALEDALYRLKTGMNVVSGESITVNGYTTTLSLVTTATGKIVNTTSDRGGIIRKMEAKVTAGVGAAFSYGVQVGEGGFTLSNSSTIRGNVYSNGPIVGANSNVVYGDVVSAGPAGLVNGVHATSSIYAHSIQNSTADKDAYYTAVTNTKASGVNCPNSHCHPGSPDQPTMELPINDGVVLQWENDALAGGTATTSCSGGNYNISGGSVTLGPKKIPCNLNISGTDTVVTLAGAIWVTGNINISGQPVIRVSPSFVGKSVPMIADNPSNQTSSSIVYLSNGNASEETFQGAGDNSFILFLSQNKSAEIGGSSPAISISNSVNGDALIYAGHGLVTISNSIKIKELTAYKVQASNTAEVVYSTGLASILFVSGPTGGWDIQAWKEVQ